MEIVSEGSLESISRPASCDIRVRELSQQKHGLRGSFEELPPEVVSSNLDEDVDSEDDDEIISTVEHDVVIEDIAERSSTNCSSFTEEEITEEVNDNSDTGTPEPESHVAKHELSQTEDSSQDPMDIELDPKIRKGLEKIRKLDGILANKIKKEKEVKIQRRQLEKLWREEITQLDDIREQEGHGKLDLGVGHTLALGPPNDDDQPDDVESVPVTPVFPTQPIHDELNNTSRSSAVSSDRGFNSSCDSWMEHEGEEAAMDNNKGSKKTRKRRGSKKSGMKGKEQNFVKRNIELAADAGNVIPMTEAEKKRLEELLSDETDLLMVENAYSEGLAIPAGEGFTLDSDAMSTISEIDSKLQDLVPQEEMDLLASQNTWKPLELSDRASSQDGASVIDVDSIGLGERILREEKEMRDMKHRLLAIEDQLQSLYRQTGEESEGGVSEAILAKLIGGSSRTTSRSTTVSESVLSALTSTRAHEDMSESVVSALSSTRAHDEFNEEDELQMMLAISEDGFDSRAESKLSSL